MKPEFEAALHELYLMKQAAFSMGDVDESRVWSHHPTLPPPPPREQRRPMNRAILKQMLLNMGVIGAGVGTGLATGGLVRLGLHKWAPQLSDRTRSIAGLASSALTGGIAMMGAAGLTKARELEDEASRKYLSALAAKEEDAE